MSGARPSLTVSPAERERVEAIDQLFARGPAAIAPLLEALADPSWTVRRAAVGSLAGLGQAAVAPLIGRLTGARGDETVLAATVEALVMSSGAVEAALRPLVDARDPAIAADVAQVLGRRQRAEGVPALLGLVDHGDDNVAVAAIEALGRIGSRAAVEALLSTLDSGNFFRVFPAIEVLGRAGDPRVVRPLVALLEQPTYALEATRALGRTGDRAAVAPLAERLLRTTDPVQGRALCAALGELETEHQLRFGAATSIASALRAAGDPRALAARALGLLAGASPSEQAATCAVLAMLGDEASVPALLDLALAGGEVGHAAARALQAIGRDDAVDLRAALAQADPEARKVLLPLVSNPAIAPEVTACLDDDDPEVRATACDALARLGHLPAVPLLFERLDDRSPLVVRSAVGAIQALGGPRTEALALASARAAAPGVRRWGLRILAYFGFPSALDVLLGAMSDADLKVQESAIQGLAFIDAPKARDALLNAARHSAPSVRAVGFRALGQAAPDARTEAALLRGLGDPDPWARYYACQSAGKLRVQAAIAALIERLGDDAGQVRLGAIEALSHFEEPAAWHALEAMAASADSGLQQAALIGLGIAKVAKPVIAAALDSPDAATRLIAVSALSGFAAPEDIVVLQRAARDPEPSVRSAAVAALGLRADPEASAALIALLRQEGGDRAQIHEVLAQPQPARGDDLLAALAGADDQLAPLLTAILARMQPAHSPAALLSALSMSNPCARRAAAVTLGGLGSVKALAAVRAAATRDPDAEVRRICAAVLGPG